MLGWGTGSQLAFCHALPEPVPAWWLELLRLLLVAGAPDVILASIDKFVV